VTRATLFDFNGVLVDDEAVHLEAFREVVRPLGITLDDATYAERYLGFDDAGAFRAMLADAGRPASESLIAQLIEEKKPAYMQRIESALVVFEGAVELVRRRAALGPCAIVSGALRHEIDYALQKRGVEGAIRFVVSAEDTSECKPSPEGYLLALQELASLGHEGPGGVVVLEDSLAGVAAAKLAGLRCAAVAHSYAADKLAAAGADVVALRLAELTDALLDGER
jgi:beta-phosphoglucomutase-like phosphatase (HAD superfamily)